MRIAVLVLLVTLSGCANNTSNPKFDVEEKLDFSKRKALEVLENIDVKDGFPRSIKKGEHKWSTSGISGWTSGFFPGMLWYLYEYSGDEKILEAAKAYSQNLKPIKELDWNTHDLGFMMYCSVGNGYRLTGNEEYKEWLLQTADSLAALYNPHVGTILSWPWMKRKRGWPHNTIIDNMLNLELLFWAAKNGGSKELYDMAVTHALTTIENHFRDDFSTYHVVVYDEQSPMVLQKITDQGFSDESVWARGQAWAIYGFTMCYRETGMTEFKEAAIRASDFYLNNLPSDYVPYWDFKLPSFTGEERDVSAAAIAASAFIELATLVEEKELEQKYLQAATNTLKSLSSNYLSKTTMAILDHSVGSKPHDSEVDVPIIYADYYYVEALTRLMNF
jgi:unsaturated chondroitin disaccharide hydrolase